MLANDTLGKFTILDTLLLFRLSSTERIPVRGNWAKDILDQRSDFSGYYKEFQSKSF